MQIIGALTKLIQVRAVPTDFLTQMGIRHVTPMGQIAGVVALIAGIALALLIVALILSKAIWEKAFKVDIVKQKHPPYRWFVRAIVSATVVLIIAFILLAIDNNIAA